MGKSSARKVLRQQVASALAKEFYELKQTLGEKKFSKKIKKASKLLTAGIPSKKLLLQAPAEPVATAVE